MVHPIRRTVPVLLAVVFLGVPAGVLAQQNQQQKKKVLWVSYGQALADASDRNRGVFIYFVGKGQKKDHEMLRKKPMADFSREHPCVRIPYDPEEPAREDFGVPDHTTVIITDWFGNELRRFVLKGLETPLPFAEVRRTLGNLQGVMQGMQKKLSRRVHKAKAELGRLNYRKAMKILGEVLQYEGYPAVTKAEKALRDVYSAGEDIILEMFKSGEASPEDSIATLRQVMVDFKDTPVEASAKDAIEKIRAIAKKKSEGPG